MKKTMRCGDGEALAAYLYDECGPAEREQIAAHLSQCPECAAEIASLHATRTRLGAWAAPALTRSVAPDVVAAIRPAPCESAGPRLVEHAPSRGGAWWMRPLPAWAQAAAALLIFAAGLAFGGAWGSAPTGTPAAFVAPDARPVRPADISRDDLARVEAQIEELRGEMARVRVAVSDAPARESGLARSQVEALIAASERRQQEQLALRTAQLARDFEVQRRADLARVEGALGTIQRVTGAEVRQHREAITQINNMLVNASLRR